MSKVTQELLNEFVNCQNRMDEILALLYDKAEEVGSWENENLDKKNIIHKGSNWNCDKIEIDEDDVYFHVYESWAYGGYDENEVPVKLYKLISDDWKDLALKEHLDKLEDERKTKELAEKEKAIKKEELERAEYERLKAKYE